MASTAAKQRIAVLMKGGKVMTLSKNIRYTIFLKYLKKLAVNYYDVEVLLFMGNAVNPDTYIIDYNGKTYEGTSGIDAIGKMTFAFLVDSMVADGTLTQQPIVKQIFNLCLATPYIAMPIALQKPTGYCTLRLYYDYVYGMETIPSLNNILSEGFGIENPKTLRAVYNMFQSNARQLNKIKAEILKQY